MINTATEMGFRRIIIFFLYRLILLAISFAGQVFLRGRALLFMEVYIIFGYRFCCFSAEVDL